MPTTTDIRSQFLTFFEGKGHVALPSSSLVPANDPTLMFANAGMNQFKNIFTGAEKPTTPRAVTSQKCVRAGGKHNDLDNVGYTARHHTFFEMLGNFSFGDYFKEMAIVYAWELLTKVYQFPKEKLIITVHPDDDEAKKLWKKIAGYSDAEIISLPENIWMMGPTGPCGPNSEIFYDHGPNVSGGLPGSPEEDGDRYVEIWNLVFMQYEQIDEKTRINLPKPSIDTGSGLERVAAALQGVTSNYDIDLFKTLIAASQHEARNAKPESRTSHNIIADHLRSSSFLIADGVLPSNEGRGYVLRRIMRRAMRHAHMLGCRDPLMHKLVPTLVHEMGAAYPELKRAEAVIVETLKLEEEKFKETLERGLKLLEEEKLRLISSEKEAGSVVPSPLRGGLGRGAADKAQDNSAPPHRRPQEGVDSPAGGELSEPASIPSHQFPGAAAFKLYDTYGFPLDLTQDILRAENITVDLDGFNAAMAEQKAKARAAWKGSGQSATAGLWFDVKEKVGATEFLGYSMESAQGQITAIIQSAFDVKELKAGEIGQIIVNQTPFYAESGGQVGDTGLITSKAASARVTDTTKPLDGLFVHDVHLDEGMLRVGDTVTLTVDSERRNRIRANHSATHLLHAVLRHQLGEHITQKGSLVGEDKLRFDVTHPKQITYDELCAIEAEVNRLIWQNSAVNTRLMSQDDAIKAGAMALFGEKYGAEVRVLSMGYTNHESRITNYESYSLELCGGTHVKHTGDIGLFKILSEGAVAAGVRRIEAVTQEGAYQHMVLMESLLRDAAGILKTKPEELAEKVAALQEEKKKLEKQLTEAKKQAAMGGGSGEATVETVGAVKLAHRQFAELDAKSLRDLATSMQQKHTDAVSVLLASSEGKASIIIAVGKDLAGKVDAPTLVKDAVVAVGGKGGGGRPDFAQGGGPEGDKLEAALAAVKTALVA